ncbi:hypothetical protein TNCV_3025271 [Trichonephila clavipes]|nr:hypothetical protein TNCV_3025271 [Trichonephila clavipes]
MTVEIVDFARQINLEVDSDDVHQLLDLHNQELTIDEFMEIKCMSELWEPPPIVRVQYFVRGGFVGHRSRVSSKHLSSLIFRSTVFDSSGVKKRLRCSCKMNVWVSGPTKISPAAESGYVTGYLSRYNLSAARAFPFANP